MQIYTVHIKRGGGPEDAQFVPDKWSWAGFAFGPLWLIWHRQWLATAGFVCCYAVLTGIGMAAGLDAGAAAALSGLLNSGVGLEGGNLRRATLERGGSPVVAVIAADTLEEAEVRFFSARPPARPAPPSATHVAPTTSAPAGIIGLFPQAGGRL